MLKEQGSKKKGFISLLTITVLSFSVVAFGEEDGYVVDLTSGGRGSFQVLEMPAFCINQHREMPVGGSQMEIGNELASGDLLKIVDLQKKIRNNPEAIAKMLRRDEKWGETIRKALVYMKWLTSPVMQRRLQADPEMKKEVDSCLSTYKYLTSEENFSARCQYAVWSVTDSLNKVGLFEFIRESNDRKPADKKESEEIMQQRCEEAARYIQAILDEAGVNKRFDSEKMEKDELAKNEFLKKFKEARKLYFERKYPAAIVKFDECAKLPGISSIERSEIRVWLAKCYYVGLKEYKEAEKELVKALEDDSSGIMARYELALVYQIQKKWSEAKKEFAEVVKSSPTSYTEAHYQLGTSLHKLKDYKGAIESFNHYIEYADPEKDSTKIEVAKRWIVVLTLLLHPEKGGSK